MDTAKKQAKILTIIKELTEKEIPVTPDNISIQSLFYTGGTLAADDPEVIAAAQLHNMPKRIVLTQEYKTIKKQQTMSFSNTNTINGTYGSGKTPCNVFTYETTFGTWYVVEGSQNVNFTTDILEDGVDVEEVSDTDCFTWGTGINSEEELEAAVEG